MRGSTAAHPLLSYPPRISASRNFLLLSALDNIDSDYRWPQYMQKKIFVFLFAGLSVVTAFAAKKPKAPAKPAKLTAPAIPQMTDDQKVLHALNRLTFGPRPGDVDQVKQMGLQRWIEQQLNPESIPENPVLIAKLAPLDTLQMTTSAMLEKYPSPGMIKDMIDGRLPLPTEPQTLAMVQTAIARYQRKQAADAAANMNGGVAPQPGQIAIGGVLMTPPPSAQPTALPNPDVVTQRNLDNLPLDAEQKQEFLQGNQQQRLELLESLPEDSLVQVIEALPAAVRNRLSNAGPADLRRRVEVITQPQQVVNRDLTEGKLLRAVYSNRQLEEVLTDFWFNHFNIYMDKGADRFMLTAYERDVIRPHVLGKFKDLLLATAQSPAMLFYLDNWESASPPPANLRVKLPNARKQGLNENYGRELMELHTLGVDGGYTQQDVTEVARCFTGWTILQPNQGGGFFFNPRMHDKGEKHVLGVTIPAGGGIDDGLKVLDILSKSPATARFISKSLAIRFVSDNPPDSLIDKMAATFTATDGDLRAVMRTMLGADEFWAAGNFRSKLKSPLEMVVSSVRAVNGDVDTALQMANLLNTMGEPLYRKQEPTGYTNRGGDWLNSASLLARMNFASNLTQGRIAGVKVDAAQFAGETAQVEHNILLTDVSPVSQQAIDAGLDLAKQTAKPGQNTVPTLVAGLTLGSPDFQRR